jgi:hypothetical protein
METITTVNTNYFHYVLVGEAKLDLRQTLRGLTAVMTGHPAAIQQRTAVEALKSVGAVQDSDERPRGRNDYWLVPGPSAAGFLADLQDALAKAQVREEQLTEIVQEAVAEYAPVNQVAVAGPKI